MKKTVILYLAAILLFLQNTYAQLNFEQLIQAGPQDAEKLVDAYARPLFYGFGLGMNSGWTNTAQTLKPLHFDLRLVATSSLVPASRQTFDITQIGLSSNLRPADPLKTVSPTFTGDINNNGPLVDLFDGNNNKLISIELPSAIIRNFVPTPQVQLTAGFFGRTEIMVRAAPKIKLGEYFGSVSLIGFGTKHNIVRDFVKKDVEKTPVDLSILAGFTRLKYGMNLNLQPLNGMVPETPEQAKDFSSQEIHASFNNYIIQLTLSKQISFFTPFVSAGYSISSMNLGLKGNFPIINSIRDNQPAYITYTDPFQLKRTYLRTMRGDVGFQLKFPVFRIYGAYGFSSGYGMLSGGIGIGI